MKASVRYGIAVLLCGPIFMGGVYYLPFPTITKLTLGIGCLMLLVGITVIIGLLEQIVKKLEQKR